MLFIIASLCGPALGGGKGSKFSTKHMITGNYTITVTKNGKDTGKIFKGTFVTKNGSTTGVLNQVEEYQTSENKTDFKILSSRNVELFADSDDHVKIVIDGAVYLDAKITLDKDENVYKYTMENSSVILKLHVYNGLYAVIQKHEKATKDQIEIKFRKERQVNQSNKLMLAMQPLMLIGNFLMQRKMKNRNMNQLNQMQQQQQQALDAQQAKEDTNAEVAKDNEGEDSKGQEASAKDDDKKED